MNISAVLNDSAERKDAPRPPPRLQTSQSSHDYTSERAPSYDDRQTPVYPPSAHAIDLRSTGPSYFPAPSPAPPNSASSPSAGTHSAYTQSPGPHGHYSASRDSSTPHHAYPPKYMLVPSPANPYPTTPGSVYNQQQQQQQQQQQTPEYASPYAPQPPLQPRPLTREGVLSTNGGPQTHPHNMSPPSHYHQPPSTPLGPPLSYPRPSPQVQRPLSQGYDNYRRLSISSVGSAHSYSARTMSQHQQQPETGRAGSVQRTHSGDEALQRDRERSIESVSPKTIPRPALQRRSTGPYSQEPTPTPNFQSPTPSVPPFQHLPPQPLAVDRHIEDQPSVPSNHPSLQSIEARASSNYSARPSPGPRATNSMTPQSTHSSLPPQPSPEVKKEPSLKRNASVISTAPTSVMPPQKRVKREEIPVWARSARSADGKRLRFNKHAPDARPVRSERPLKKESVVKAEVAHETVTNGPSLSHASSQPPADATRLTKWEESILNTIPYEELTKSVCDWIFLTVGGREAPAGAAFEIEAKIGAIIDTHNRGRIQIPVKSEAIFDKEHFTGTKFESVMNIQQHKMLNEFLNNLSHRSFKEVHDGSNPGRECIRAAHTIEVDEFFELTREGVQELPRSFLEYLPRGREVKVRRTMNTKTNELRAQIIKTRIADLEVYSPMTAFDYRISISLEIPWDGSPQHLQASKDSGRDRQKDRVSYRHHAYQIDLTQISHASSPDLQHELEVEISVDETKREIENLKAGRENRYEELVRSFINNVRILCREGTRPSTR